MNELATPPHCRAPMWVFGLPPLFITLFFSHLCTSPDTHAYTQRLTDGGSTSLFGHEREGVGKGCDTKNVRDGRHRETGMVQFFVFSSTNH